MKKIAFIVAFLLFQLGCQTNQISPKTSEKIHFPARTVSASEISPEEKTISENQGNNMPYPGVTIDQKFPIIEAHDFTEENFKGKTFVMRIEGFEVSFLNFAPRAINKNNGAILTFAPSFPEDYHSSLVGAARLLGEKSKQIYVVAGGPGAVCCTNYWITDVSGEKPRSIFRSQDFGGFRDPMEVFDADGDEIYELVQFDSAFRYFMGDCGACSPEPRAVFKYDKKTGAYRPAKGIQQDFVKVAFDETEEWIFESFKKLEKEDLPELKTEYSRRFLDYVVNLFYLGEENKAWRVFDKHYIGYADKEKTRAEIKHRLRQSKFFQALKKAS
jgi:hypothetical protein